MLFGNLMLLSLFFVGCCSVDSLEQLPSKQVTLSDSIQIDYKVSGQGEPALVFIHGFGCDMNAWEAQFDYFKDKSQVIFIDMPGYGKSSRPHVEYTLDFYADAVKAVLDTLKVQNAVLTGHSLGTAICRQVALREPYLISKLVDVDGVYCFFPEDPELCAMFESQYNAFVSMFAGENIEETMTQFIQPLFVEQTPENVKAYATGIMPTTPQYVAYSTMKNLVERKYWTNEKIEIPSLVFAAKSSQIPPDYEAIMQMLYSQMQYEELDSIGHFIMMEQPEMFNKTLSEFINK